MRRTAKSHSLRTPHKVKGSRERKSKRPNSELFLRSVSRYHKPFRSRIKNRILLVVYKLPFQLDTTRILLCFYLGMEPRSNTEIGDGSSKLRDIRYSTYGEELLPCRIRSYRTVYLRYHRRKFLVLSLLDHSQTLVKQAYKLRTIKRVSHDIIPPYALLRQKWSALNMKSTCSLPDSDKSRAITFTP